MKPQKDQQGLIALISILVISSIVLLITITMSWQSTSELQMSWWTNQSEQAYSLADSCLEEGLNKLRLNWQNHNGNLEIDDNSCIIEIETTVDLATVAVVANVDQTNRSITATVDQNFQFINWQEN
ncbi:MAG: hypothetical protein ABH884_01030 [Candidatus Komeilibacteria bacterium]